MFLFLCFVVFAFPLFGQSRSDLTRDLGKAIEEWGRESATVVASLLEKGADPNGVFSGKEKTTFLMKAVSDTPHRVEITKLLLDYGADPNIRDSNGNTAVYYVDKYFAVELLGLLTAKGARFDITNGKGESPLMYFINRRENIPGITFLLEWEETYNPGFTGGFPDRKTYCTTILSEVLGINFWGPGDDDDGRFPLAERLLKAGVDPNGIFHDWGDINYPFFIQAVKKGYNRVAGLLLDYGADPEVRDNDECTAAFYCNAKGAALLVARGIRFDVSNKWGTSPLMLQGASDAPEAIIILEWEEKHSPHFSARFENRKEYLTHILARYFDSSFFGDFDVPETRTLIGKLLDGGANPAATGSDGVPIASLAARSNVTQFIIPLLIDRGTPLDAFTRNGNTILYNAAHVKNVELVRYLLGKRADPNQQSSSGETALMTACSGYRSDVSKVLDIISLLLKSGADPNLVDNKGETALMHVRQKEPARLLLGGGADPSIKDLRGRTVMHHWTNDYLLADIPLLDEIISRGCFVDEPDREDETPLMLAAQYRYDKLVTALLEKGADPLIRDSKGRTALHRYLIRVEDLNESYYREDDYESITAALLAAGTQPAVMDNEGDSALLVAMRLSKRHEEMAPLRNLMMEYASVEDVKIAQSTASKIVAQEKRGKIRSNLAYELPRIMGALSFPLTIGGLSIGMREFAFRNNPSDNFMGMINGVLDFTMGGMALGILLFLPSASDGGWSNLLPFFGGIFGGGVGFIGGLILVGLLPSITETINNNPLLYYLPTALSAIVTTIVIVKLRY